jgi:ABC-type multidrug transport system permease subunit
MNTARILAVVEARNREFFRDKAGLGWNLLMPVLMLIGFAFIFHQPQPDQYRVGVLQPTGESVAFPFLDTRYIDFIDQSDEAAAIDKVRYHRLDLLLDLRTTTPRYWVNELSANGYLVERLLWQSLAGADDGIQRQSVAGREIRYVDWVLPGILAINVMFSSLWGVGWVIVRYRKNGVLRRLRATPLTAGEFLTAQILSRLLVVISMTLLVFAGTHLLLDFPMRGSYLVLALVFLVGAMALISMGLVVAARVRSEEVANGLLDMVAFPMMILSGVWFSMEGTNIWAQRLAELMPLSHLVDAARRIMLDGAGLADVTAEIGILAGTAVVLLALSARLFRWQ